MPESDEWRCVLRGRIVSLQQDPSHLYYRSYAPQSTLLTPPSTTPTPHADLEKPLSSGKDPKTDETLAIITHYLNLTSNLTELYTQWSDSDPNFKKKAPNFTGIRILRQDAWEALVSFICSSNNNIARISQMVEKLCTNYGDLVGTIDGYSYHDFPRPEALTGEDVEGRLRGLGFGYRAKYIYQTAVMVAKDRENGWLDSLRNPESPAFGVEPSPGGDMKPEGREGYRNAHEKLLELQGVGPKVADCVSLMGLGWGEAVPVDTHGTRLAILISRVLFLLTSLCSLANRTTRLQIWQRQSQVFDESHVRRGWKPFPQALGSRSRMGAQRFVYRRPPKFLGKTDVESRSQDQAGRRCRTSGEPDNIYNCHETTTRR